MRENRKNFITTQGNDVFLDPARYFISQREAITSEVISCSLISNLKNTTYMNMCFGLVLRVPKNNILAADATDLAAATLQGAGRVEKLHGRNEYKRTLAINEFLNNTPGYAQPDLPTPNAVLDQTRVDGHNEVIVLGAFAGQVTVTALFVKTSNGMLWEDFLGKEGTIAPVVRQESFNLLPIIPIEDPRGKPSKMPFTVWANGPLQIRRPRKMY